MWPDLWDAAPLTSISTLKSESSAPQARSWGDPRTSQTQRRRESRLQFWLQFTPAQHCSLMFGDGPDLRRWTAVNTGG
jgi:hypothetical protein